MPVASGQPGNLQGQEAMMNGQGMTLQAMQQMMAAQQQQQLQQHFQQHLIQQHQQQAVVAQQVIPQQATSVGQQYITYQQPVQVLANTRWSNQFDPTPVMSQQQVLSHQPVAPMQVVPPMKVVPPTMVSSASAMKTVSSQGMLLPLVKMPENPQKPIKEENPKAQMKQCMNVIEEALMDPSLADAGKMLLKAMHASSSYMSGMLEANKQLCNNQVPLKPAPQPGNPDKRVFLNSSMGSREAVPSQQLSMEQTIPPKEQISAVQVQQAQVPQVSPELSSAQPVAQPQVAVKPVIDKQKPTVHKASCGRLQKDYKPVPLRTSFGGSPHQFLLTILKERGYNIQATSSQDGGYHANPTTLQVASFGTSVVQAVHSSDTERLSKLLSAGLSPNPCNQFGDSILSLICKRADFSVFKLMVDHGCDLQVSDSFGRTCLHSLAWAGNFSAPMAKVILDVDLNQLLIQDKRGQCPLECVRKEHWNEWISFLRENMDVYWPISHNRPARQLPRDTRMGSTLPDPRSALSPEIAVKLAAGEITPEEASKRKETTASNNFDLLF